MSDQLTDLILKGRKLLAVENWEAYTAYSAFAAWDHSVTSWIERNLGAKHLAAWSAIEWPVQVERNDTRRAPRGITHSIENAAKARMNWIAKYATIPASADKNQPISDTVFIVHGHDEKLKYETAHYIDRFKLKVVILHEQANKGRTLIEKFTDHADVGFAVVLLTGDDRGGLSDEPYEKQRPRARQNVIFELGFFLGLIGRQRVCALYEPGVEIPSDYQGVIFIQADAAGAWKMQLAKEMKEAGLPVDLNDAV